VRQSAVRLSGCRQYERATHSISLVDADQSFCSYVSHGRARFPAQLQHASNCQANDDESADEHTERDYFVFGRETGFAHCGIEPSRSPSGSLLRPSNFTARPTAVQGHGVRRACVESACQGVERSHLWHVSDATRRAEDGDVPPDQARRRLVTAL
jgi:hypothetical protein